MDTAIEVLNDLFVHISEVRANLSDIRHAIELRGESHDASKFQSVEFDAFVSTREKFRTAEYGSKEYSECTQAIRPAIDHHYAANRHHTAHYPGGINDMSLIDILEMLADWRSANNRNPTLKFSESLKIAFAKYSISEEMQRHIVKTLEQLGWMDEE